MEKTKKVMIFSLPLILIVFCVGIYMYSISTTYANKRNIRFLNKYGWSVASGGLSEKGRVLGKGIIDIDVYKMRILASSEIGLNPECYLDMPIDIYMYELEDKLNEGNISAEVWVNGKNIICSFLFHSESNLPLRYWPLTTPRFVIRSEYEQLFKEFKEFKEKYK